LIPGEKGERQRNTKERNNERKKKGGQINKRKT
jgi:hypothetical protein